MDLRQLFSLVMLYVHPRTVHVVPELTFETLGYPSAPNKNFCMVQSDADAPALFVNAQQQATLHGLLDWLLIT